MKVTWDIDPRTSIGRFSSLYKKVPGFYKKPGRANQFIFWIFSPLWRDISFYLFTFWNLCNQKQCKYRALMWQSFNSLSTPITLFLSLLYKATIQPLKMRNFSWGKKQNFLLSHSRPSILVAVRHRLRFASLFSKNPGHFSKAYIRTLGW